ncbi:hypothetical protein D1007_40735 [Hordeum vulgare]|nr:hypothetical protein D1007_40735 [Hordeum vulgare]
MRVERRLEIDREKIELGKQEAAIKWELEKVKTFGEIELEKESKRLAEKKKEINNHRALQEARVAAEADHAAKMQLEHATRMQAKMASQVEQEAWIDAFDQ